VIKTPDSPLLIGQHGKNIEAFSHLIGRIAEKKLGKFIHVHLEVNDYMKAKDERLFRFLESKIAFALSSGKSIRMPNLTSFERKKAHNYIAEKKIE
jgi:predicted RNA-binding protein Jag